MIGAHALQLNHEDIGILKRLGTKLAICPTSEAKLNALMAPALEIDGAGIPLGLGTDSAACQNSFDMFQEMKFTALLNKFGSRDPYALSASRVLEMATIGGAKALGAADYLGSIEKGKAADITVVDASGIGMVPQIDAIGNLVYGSNLKIDTVLVDGKVVVEGRRLVNVDQDRVAEEAEGMVKNLVARVAPKIDCPSFIKLYEETLRGSRTGAGQQRAN